MTDRRLSRLRLNRVDCPGRSGQSGTTVGLAARLGIPAAALLVLAACNPDLRGDAITRPFFTSQPAEVAETASAETVEQTSSVPFQQQDYVVAREGDTIRLIAERHGLDPGRIAEFNGLYVDDSLEAGRIILIPADQSRRATSAITEIAESAIAEAESASGTRTATAPNPGTHVVKEGETVTGIAKRYGIPEQELRRANNLPESANLAVGEGTGHSGTTIAERGAAAFLTDRGFRCRSPAASQQQPATPGCALNGRTAAVTESGTVPYRAVPIPFPYACRWRDHPGLFGQGWQ